MAEDVDSYPWDVVGDHAPPPEVMPADLIDAWREHEADLAADLDEPPLRAAGNLRMARSLTQLLAEADAHNPHRDRRSDGGIGNARHYALGSASDHNPWVIVDGAGVVRARDFDVSGLDVAAAFERMRAKAAAGHLPQLIGGGYLIHAGRITDPSFRFWRDYQGENPHVTHGHVSVSRDPGRFDDRRHWNVWAPPRPTTPRPRSTTPRSGPAKPTAATPPRWTGPDLRGTGPGLRGAHGASGPRVQRLQRFLARVFPAYAGDLVADGHWGDATTRVLRIFGHRSGVPSADGRNIGPQLARRLHRAGFGR